MILFSRLKQTFPSAPIQILIGLFCLFCWWIYLPNQWIGMLAGALVSFGLIRLILPSLIEVDWRTNRKIFFVALGLSALLILMMPVDWFYTKRLFFEGLKPWHVPYRYRVVADIAANTAGLLFAAGMAFILMLKFWLRLKQTGLETPTRTGDWRRNLTTVLLYALPGLLVWNIFLYAYWPGILTPDSYATWLQITGHGFDDWVPVSFTLLVWLLTRLWYTPAIVCLFLICTLSLFWGGCMTFFENQGLPRKHLFPLSIGFALLPSNPIMLITIWKDIPYTIVNLALVYLLGLIWLSQGEWLRYRRNQVLLGIVLALPFLFRHNGLLILGLVPLVLLISYWNRWKTILLSTVLAVVIVVVLRDGLELGLLQAKPNPASVMYVVPIQHISAVVHEIGAPYNAEQKEVLKKIAPIDAWRDSYNPLYADNLTKPWGVMNDPQVLDKITNNKEKLFAIFLNFTRRYPLIVLKSEINLTRLVWEITANDEYMNNNFDFVLTSTPADPPLDASLFMHPRLDSPSKEALDTYLRYSNTDRFLYAIFWKGGFYLFLTLMFTIVYILRHDGKFFLLAVPTLANAASLVISIPVQNFRYIYPIVGCTFLIALFGLLKPKTRSTQVGDPLPIPNLHSPGERG